ncbi:PIN domain-containing protein [archaeon]|nr:PIN domain-containing protein [archaeon]
MANYFIDTNIWRDYWQDRNDGWKPLGEFAFQLFKKILLEKHRVFYSGWIEHELRLLLSRQQIDLMFSEFIKNGLLKKAAISNAQADEATRLAFSRKVPKGDALIAILARDNDAIIVSRDRHFELLNDLAGALKPEDII